ncbi:hypothetical protein BGZ99_009092 [Dissophora globulifera]|uniref:DNA polymerase delta subunit 4 n=1 Tax=Dissophora globulifera TaxID=979702 RepID=A0A9P6RAB0_9FUNG|nr:hypothetical protein BGZ99_009092 [Dissophora globulifera]
MTPKSPTTTASHGTKYFQRGKKPTTAQRVVTAKKKSTAAPTSLSTRKAKSNLKDGGDHDHDEEDQQILDEIDDTDSSEDGRSPHLSEQDHEDDEADDDDHALTNDEIQSDDSDVIAAAPMRKTIQTQDISSTKLSSGGAKPIPSKSNRKTASRSKKPVKDAYVAPYVGDIYAGFHQSDLSETEKVLRQFDLTSKYGPCTELTRLERWERASLLGLNPPQHVKDTIVAHAMALNNPVFEGRV